jgi:hypothetical protein
MSDSMFNDEPFRHASSTLLDRSPAPIVYATEFFHSSLSSLPLLFPSSIADRTLMSVLGSGDVSVDPPVHA